jgi:hypothetical protein
VKYFYEKSEINVQLEYLISMAVVLIFVFVRYHIKFALKIDFYKEGEHK